MSPPRQTALRMVANAQLRLLSTDDASLTDARDFLARALFEVEHLRDPHQDPVGMVLGRAMKIEHISAPLGRAIEKLKQGGEG